MSQGMKALVIVAALCGQAPAALAQDGGKVAAATNEEAAEEAFLKAYFQEKELRAITVAEKAYAELIASGTASHEVLGRALLGRARCLRFLKRADEADALFARVEKEFADIADAASEAAAARKASTASADGPLDARIRSAIEDPMWQEVTWKYGERGVPVLVGLLRDDSPEIVFRAAETLSRMQIAAAHEALVGVIDARSSTYPEQVRNAVTAGFAVLPARKRLAHSKDSEVRSYALSSLVLDFEDAEATDIVLRDSELRSSLIASVRSSANYGRLLLAAVAHGGEAREAALARLRSNVLNLDAVSGLGDPPAAVLSDAEALAAIAPHVLGYARVNRPAGWPSPALVVALVRQPGTAASGVRLTLAANAPSSDAGAFVDAVARTGFGEPLVGTWSDPQLADALVAALGSRPAPGLLKRLAAGWPEYRDWSQEGGRLPAFLDRLLSSGVTGEASLLAFQEGLGADRNGLRRDFVAALRRARRGADPGWIWPVNAFLRELTTESGREAHDMAATGLSEWQTAFGAAAGLSAHVPVIVAALGRGGSDQLIGVLSELGRPAIDALRESLPTHPHKDVVVEALARAGDESAAATIERVLADAAEVADAEQRGDLVAAAAKALAVLREDASKDAIAAALLAHDGRDAPKILEAIGEFGSDGVKFGDRPKFELCRLTLEKLPGALREWGDRVASRLAPEMRRELAIAALRSSSVQDRFWGADAEKDLLDVAAWDALLAAAQDTDKDVRDTAREALRSIRAREAEMADFRAIGEERATRKRIESLVAAKDPRQRRAGVAAIAATGLAGMVNELIRLAAEDEDDDVRDDARKALLAMAKPAPSAQPSPAPADKR